MIDYLEHHIVDHCNLNCAGCSHFSPLASEWYESLEDFRKDFTELANKTNTQVKTIRIMGGEPLLHPQVTDFLITARQLFPVSEIQLVTNGILLSSLKNTLVDICNQYKIVVCVSNYHLNINLTQLLTQFKYIRIDQKGLMYNIALDTTGSQIPTNSFAHCDLHVHKWYYFQYGCFFPCCIGANIHYFNQHFNLNLDDTNTKISIYDHTIDEVITFLSQPIPLCRYCNTLLRQSNYFKFHPSKKEIKEWIYQ